MTRSITSTPYDVQMTPLRVWPLWPLHAILTVLLLGPLIAPLFQATRLPLLADAGWLARDLLSTYICPTPAKSYLLMEFPMAVCARCWGATIGLWVGWGLLRRAQSNGLIATFLGMAWPVRLLIAALPFVLWPIEIIGWPNAALELLLLNGILAGVGAGLFFGSIWPGARSA